MRGRIAVLLSLLTLAPAGCSSGIQTVPAVQLSANFTLHMKDAVPLMRLRGPDNDIEVVYKIPGTQMPRAIYFGDAGQPVADSGWVPKQAFVAVREGGNWRALVLVTPNLANPSWEFVASGPANGEAWGVLTSGVYDSEGFNPDPRHNAKTLMLAHTVDQGVTWDLTLVPKPVYAAHYNDFCISSLGNGRLTLFLAVDVDGFKRGYYHYLTRDGGKSWSEVRFEANGLTVADDVAATEQPDTRQRVAAQVSFRR